MVLAGTEALLLQLLNHLHQTKKADVTLLLPYPSSEDVLLEKLDTGIKLRYIHDIAPIGWRKKYYEIMMIFNPRKFRKKLSIDTSDYDCCIAFKEGFLANVFYGVKEKNILWIHNLLYRRQYSIRSMKERFAIALNKREIATTYRHYQEFDLVLCVSSACEDAFREVVGIDKTQQNKIKVLPNGVDFTRIRQLAQQYKPNFDRAYHHFVLVTRDSVDKCPIRILEIAKILKEREIGNVRFHLIGLNGDEDIFTTYPFMDDVSNYIVCYGKLDNPYPYIQYADWSLCVSDRESFSLSVLESLVLSTPVLTTACGGPEGILEYGRYGMIVSKSSLSLADAIVEIIDDKSIAESYQQQMKDGLGIYELSNWLLSVDDILNC